MTTLREYFEAEARDALAQLERGLGQMPRPDIDELYRTARALRGTAQMARQDRVHRAASAFESALRALSANTISWSDDVNGRARATLGDLRSLVERSDAEERLEERLTAVVQRWASLGIALPAHVTGSESPSEPGGSGEFRAFAAREVVGIADALEKGVQQLAVAPMDREALKTILRRQRALLGSARLDDIPVVAEILRAVDDLTRVIAKLDVGVKQEWLDIYRVAREGLKAAVAPLQRDEDPTASHALSRLRHMREELLDRYGAGEAVSAAHETGGLVQATEVTEPPAPVALSHGTAPQEAATAEPADAPGGAPTRLLDAATGAATQAAAAAGQLAGQVAGAVAAAASTAAATVLAPGSSGATSPEPGGSAGGGPGERTAEASQHAGTSAGDAAAEAGLQAVPIEDLCYRGRAALDRVLELRGIVERATEQDPQARAAVDELFDLVRMARG
jgi:chemotaxis protein histidine kinase CheA